MPTAAVSLRPKSEPGGALDHPWIGRTLGKWTIARHVGDGGMGQVFEAHTKGGRTRVALKVLRDELASDTKFVKRFHREANVLRSLSHPHIVALLEQGESDGLLWIAMEFVRGETLRHVMRRQPMSMEAIAHIGSQIGSALDYAHKKGVIHRDLKPENIIVDEAGDIHLVDFGLSKLNESTILGGQTQLTRTDVIMGTYEYMAPEHRRGDKKIDARADVFSFGVLLYEMATGTLPLGRFALPSEHRSELPKSLDDIVSKALATRPEDRFKSASNMAIALHESGAFEDARCHKMARARRGVKSIKLAASQALSKRRARKDASKAAETDDVNDEMLKDARRMLRHIELVASIDKAVAVLFLLAGTVGIPFVGEFISFPSVSAITGISLTLIILGVMLWRQGKALSQMRPGSRSKQVTTSALLCLIPPVITVGGLYGLFAMSSERARRAFRLGKEAILDDGTPELRRHAARLPAPPRPKNAPMPFAPHRTPKDIGIGMRMYALVGVLLGLYAGLVCTSIQLWGKARVHADIMNTHHDGIVNMSSTDIHAFGGVMLVACLVSVLVLMYAFARRHVVRGWGLAFVIASMIWGGAWWLHNTATAAGFSSPLWGHAL